MANKETCVKAAGNKYSNSLASSLNNSALSMTVNDATGLNANGGYVVIDKGVSGKEEVVYYESRSGNVLTIATDGRGKAGTSAVAHDSGASVKDVLVDDHINGIRGAFLTEHDDDGGHKQIDSAIVLSGNVANSSNKLLDANGGNTASGTAISTTNQLVDEKYLQATPGQLINGKLSVTVASNNITVAIKTLAGNDPSTTDPVEVRIGNAIRQITAALSVTVNAGANSFNAGASELATQEIDYFAYVGWRAASSAVVLGFGRFPEAQIYSDFSGTATDPLYGAFSTAPASSDEVEVCGRFAATLSASASYNWSVPTFTNKNLINRPVYETRWLTWVPTLVGFSANPTGVLYNYQIRGKNIHLVFLQGINGTSNATSFTFTLPMRAITLTGYNTHYGAQGSDNGSVLAGASLMFISSGATVGDFRKDQTGAVWTNVNGKRANLYPSEYRYI